MYKYIFLLELFETHHFLFFLGKSSNLLDVKPWDDETDMKKLEEAVRSVEIPGLTWGACMLKT
jgi:hypothetical protein